MTWESISRLSALTGRTPRTVKEKCSSLPSKPGLKNAVTYESKLALPLILCDKSNQDLDLQEERARLAKEQADKYELDNAERRGALLDAGEVSSAWQEVAASVRAKLLPLPVKVARVALSSSDLREIELAVKKEIYQALNELAALGDLDTSNGGES